MQSPVDRPLAVTDQVTEWGKAPPAPPLTAYEWVRKCARCDGQNGKEESGLFFRRSEQVPAGVSSPFENKKGRQ